MHGINRRGVIAGSYKDSAGTYHGFARNADGELTTFAPIGSTDTYAFSIDNKNRITGSFIKDGATVLGFERHNDGTIKILKVPRSLYTEPESISSAGGLITGSLDTDQPGSHGFLRSP